MIDLQLQEFGAPNEFFNFHIIVKLFGELDEEFGSKNWGGPDT